MYDATISLSRRADQGPTGGMERVGWIMTDDEIGNVKAHHNMWVFSEPASAPLIRVKCGAGPEHVESELQGGRQKK